MSVYLSTLPPGPPTPTPASWSSGTARPQWRRRRIVCGERMLVPRRGARFASVRVWPPVRLVPGWLAAAPRWAA
jgi:hypothetical protein